MYILKNPTLKFFRATKIVYKCIKKLSEGQGMEKVLRGIGSIIKLLELNKNKRLQNKKKFTKSIFLKS